jgi:hypothetical protein
MDLRKKIVKRLDKIDAKRAISRRPYIHREKKATHHLIEVDRLDSVREKEIALLQSRGHVLVLYRLGVPVEILDE